MRRRKGRESATTVLCLEHARTHTLYAVFGDRRVKFALRPSVTPNVLCSGNITIAFITLKLS